MNLPERNRLRNTGRIFDIPKLCPPRLSLICGIKLLQVLQVLQVLHRFK